MLRTQCIAAESCVAYGVQLCNAGIPCVISTQLLQQSPALKSCTGHLAGHSTLEQIYKPPFTSALLYIPAPQCTSN